MRLRTFVLFNLLMVAAFLGSNITSWKLPYAMPTKVKEGKAVWQHHNCISCHTLFGNGGYVGDDLTNLMERWSEEEVYDYLTDPPIMRPNHERLHPSLDSADTKALISYFNFIRDIPTLGWPHEPQEVELK